MMHRSAGVFALTLALSGCVISPIDGTATINANVGVQRVPGTNATAPGAPVIDMLDASPRSVGPDDVVTFTAVAHDPAGKPLQFNWSATGGVLSGNSGRVVSWRPTGAKGIAMVSLVVSNGADATTGTVNLTIAPDGSATVAAAPSPTPAPSVAPTATPTAAPTAAPTATPMPVCAIRAVEPELAAPGTIFYIRGTGFSAASKVTLGEARVAAQVVQQDDANLAVQLPKDLPVGKYQVFLDGCDVAGTLVVASTQDFGGNVQQAGQGLFANVYQLPENTEKLPDLGQLKPFTSLLVNNLDVPDHDFEQGFPGLGGNLVEWFAIRFDGMIDMPAGKTTFKVASDDGAKLYIDDKLVVDNDGTHALAEQEGQATLAAGKHKFRLDYFQGPRYRIALQLSWTPEGAKEAVIVPASAFSQGAFTK